MPKPVGYKWTVKMDGKSYGPFATREAAMAHAKKLRANHPGVSVRVVKSAMRTMK